MDELDTPTDSDIYWTEYSPTPRRGQIYGNYRVEGKMVETKCSILMKAKDIRDDSDKVLKFVKYKKELKDKCSDEIKIMDLFNHPNILKYEYSILQPPYLIIATKYAPYSNLSEFLNNYYKFGMPESLVRSVMIQILNSIDCLHKQRVWHRDIKTQNFLVFERDPDIHIQLADFGFAKQFQAKEKGKEFIGTLTYSAPEIIDKQPYTNSVDIWSVGITMYYLLVNRSPYIEFSFHNPLIDQISSGKLSYQSLRLSNVSEPAVEMIRKMCRMNPFRRPSAEQLLHDPWMESE